MLSSVNKKIHFVGVGGSGMSGIAEILHNLGFSVSGSDTKKSYTTKRLQDIGVTVFFDHSAHNVHGTDLVVVSSAIQTSNPEILEASHSNIPIVHRADMLVQIMKFEQFKERIIVAGTHGKTTTTSILSHVLHHLELDPTAVIGGQVQSFASNAKFGRGKIFIAESDESDGSFLKLNPNIAIVTNIDRDHLEHYGTLENIFDAFKSFISQVPENGVACICIDNKLSAELISSVKCPVLTYGLDKKAFITAQNIRTSGFTTTFTPVIAEQKYPDVTIHLPGQYNVVNALASFAVAYTLNLDINKIGTALASFNGVLRRYTHLATVRNHIIIDDYAHNPKKIETVLTGTKESFPNKKIFAIFQPHRYTRVKEQEDEFSKCFYHADEVIMTPIYSAGEAPIENVTVENLANKIRMNSFNGIEERVKIGKDFSDVVELCHNMITHHDTIILTMGAGDVTKIGHLLHERLTFEN